MHRLVKLRSPELQGFDAPPARRHRPAACEAGARGGSQRRDEADGCGAGAACAKSSRRGGATTRATRCSRSSGPETEAAAARARRPRRARPRRRARALRAAGARARARGSRSRSTSRPRCSAGAPAGGRGRRRSGCRCATARSTWWWRRCVLSYAPDRGAVAARGRARAAARRARWSLSDLHPWPPQRGWRRSFAGRRGRALVVIADPPPLARAARGDLARGAAWSSRRARAGDRRAARRRVPPRRPPRLRRRSRGTPLLADLRARARRGR